MLIRSDNLPVLRTIPPESIDLVYLDPPFLTGHRFETSDGHNAFDDPKLYDYREIERALAELPAHVTPILRALEISIGPQGVISHLARLSTRLVEIARILRMSGSVFFHCDPTTSHYVKLLLDVVFGPAAFQNEIVWRYRRWPAKARRFQRMHDVLLFYTKGPDHTFHTLYGYEKLAESTLKTFGTKRQVADFSAGHRKPGRTDEETAGPPLSDVWEIGVIAASGKERTGYPTQKPEALLERVILSASNPGDVVLDPYCGSGTALKVAEAHGRRWIGVDSSQAAIQVAARRLKVEPRSSF